VSDVPKLGSILKSHPSQSAQINVEKPESTNSFHGFCEMNPVSREINMDFREITRSFCVLQSDAQPENLAACTCKAISG